MSDDIGISARRVPGPWRSEFWPACIRGHREQMGRVTDRAAYRCPECGHELSDKDWWAYIKEAVGD